MNYGLQLAASGAMVSLYRQDVFTNNLANIGTVGFKSDIASAQQRDAVRQEDNLPFMPSNALLERLGGGAFAARNRTSFDQGALQTTGNQLDLAIEGEGFFVVRDAEDGDTQRIAYTRDGRFTLDSRRRIVMATSGLPVMDRFDRPIVASESGPISVNDDGVVAQGDRILGQLQVVTIPDLDDLKKEGESLFRASAVASANAIPASGRIHQGAIENSAVNEIDALLDVTDASRDVGSNIEMMRSFDRLMDLAINRFGRVA